MKTAWLLIFAVFVLLQPSVAQKDLKGFYEKKVQHYTAMRNGGFVMAGIGSGLTVIGSLLMSANADLWDDEPDSDEDPTEAYFEIMGGLLCFSIGVGLAAGGLTMGIIGSQKLGKYRGLLNNISIGIKCTPNQQGFSLTYRF